MARKPSITGLKRQLADLEKAHLTLGRTFEEKCLDLETAQRQKKELEEKAWQLERDLRGTKAELEDLTERYIKQSDVVVHLITEHPDY